MKNLPALLRRRTRTTGTDIAPEPGPGTTRYVSWNLFLGGLDGASDERFRMQMEILSDLQPDVLGLQECDRWDEDNRGRLWTMADALGMEPAAMQRSRLGTVPVTNHTALLYRPSKFQLVGEPTVRGAGVFHHALIQARLRRVGAVDDSTDVLAFAGHWSWTDGETRLRESRWLTDYGGEWADAPRRRVLLADMNTPDRRRPKQWSRIPQNMHSRYRYVRPRGRFGAVDRRAVQVLLRSGWQDPQKLTGKKRGPTVGYYYPNEPVPWSLDYILVNGLDDVQSYYTHDTPQARKAADHLPAVLDARA
ncbi:endonuclease/exonuclease/phosphatase family protein [Streptomyces sp. NPDC056672]|uniref:endonuclease/exonuclease/phosphatase family protein n=1 Tax=Streptomyces sp. NPDC056672 TaxID=3345906 RepID=UPI0036B2538D